MSLISHKYVFASGGALVGALSDWNATHSALPQQHVIVWSYGGGLTTGANMSAEVRAPISGTIVRADGSVKTVSSGSNIICDINLAGTSIWSTSQGNRLTISALLTTGSVQYFDTSTFGTGQYFTLDIDQVGSSVAGGNLTTALHITYP